MAVNSQQHVDIKNAVRTQVLMLDLCLLKITLHYQYYTKYCILFLHGHFTNFPLFVYSVSRYSAD